MLRNIRLIQKGITYVRNTVCEALTQVNHVTVIAIVISFGNPLDEGQAFPLNLYIFPFWHGAQWCQRCLSASTHQADN